MQNITGLRTVEWKNNKVIMIEQTKLPNELIFVEYDDFHQVANAIKTLRYWALAGRGHLLSGGAFDRLAAAVCYE